MTNAELKYFSKLKQKKFREQEDKFLIEGENIITECLRSENYKMNLKKVFIREDYINDKLTDMIQNSSSRIEIISLTEKNFNHLTETINPQGIIGVVAKPDRKFKDQKFTADVIVALDSVNDPGNLGTIIRTCHWFGIKDLITGTDSVEIFNSKVIRSSQGSIFYLNIREGIDLEKELELLHKSGYKIILTGLNSQIFLDEYKINRKNKYIIVFGNEANGISRNILGNKNYEIIKIRGYSECESLNISVSAGIVLNTFQRQLTVDN